VQLPAGAQSVELRFDDPAYERGKLITILAALAALVLVAIGALRSRRRSPLAGAAAAVA
jgi:MYXO-CTERM domain-containing protein